MGVDEPVVCARDLLDVPAEQFSIEVGKLLPIGAIDVEVHDRIAHGFLPLWSRRSAVVQDVRSSTLARWPKIHNSCSIGTAVTLYCSDRHHACRSYVRCRTSRSPAQPAGERGAAPGRPGWRTGAGNVLPPGRWAQAHPETVRRMAEEKYL